MSVTERGHLSIGEVLGLLQTEFPDVTISKIRFLESQGLIDPERTPSGYRKFYDADIERLRWILVQQRDHFLPLKVIKDRLDEAAALDLPLHAPPPAGTASEGEVPSGDEPGSIATQPPPAAAADATAPDATSPDVTAPDVTAPDATAPVPLHPERSDSPPPPPVGESAPPQPTGVSSPPAGPESPPTATSAQPPLGGSDLPPTAATAPPALTSGEAPPVSGAGSSMTSGGGSSTRTGAEADAARGAGRDIVGSAANGRAISDDGANTDDPGPASTPPDPDPVPDRAPAPATPAAETAAGADRTAASARGVGAREAAARTSGGREPAFNMFTSAVTASRSAMTTAEPGEGDSDSGLDVLAPTPPTPDSSERASGTDGDDHEPPVPDGDPVDPAGGGRTPPGESEPRVGANAPDPHGPSDRGDPSDPGGAVPRAGASAPGPDAANVEREPSRHSAARRTRREPGARRDVPTDVSSVSFTDEELATAAGLTVPEIDELERFGLLSSRATAQGRRYGDDALLVARLSVRFAVFGIEPCHLRMFKVAADRELALYEQVTSPFSRGRAEGGEDRAAEIWAELDELGANLRDASSIGTRFDPVLKAEVCWPTPRWSGGHFDGVRSVVERDQTR